MLYPLIFKTIFKDKIWGGQKMSTLLGKSFAPLPNCGETWEVSGVEGNISLVRDGALEGRDLASLIEEYKAALVGAKVYARFGNEFPLLVKFIDAKEDLSIQVHPGDVLAKERHNSFGKAEMWYVLQADEGSRLNAGFNKEVTKEEYLSHLNTTTLEEILNFEAVAAGDVFFLPAGRVHFIGKGVFLAEIQQTSDVTYRIYDFDRKDDQGNTRELHTELALEAIDFKHYNEYKSSYKAEENSSSVVVSCPYFITNILSINRAEIKRSYLDLDSFVIFIAVEGEATLHYESGSILLKKGDSILLPAVFKQARFTSEAKADILEVYIP